MIAGLRNEADDGEDFRRLYEFTEPLEGLTCLHFAALRGNIQICRFLIDNVKIDVDFKCHLGYTPLLFAARDRHFNVVKYLIIRGADVKMSDYEGMTCLHMAAILGDIEIMQLLLKGADIEAHSVSGTPLQSAATCGTGNIESIRFLLRRGADPNAVSPLSVPPLVLAIQCGSSECLELLLEAGANPNMTWRGLSPLAVAAKEDNTKLIKSLLAAGAEPNNDNDNFQAKMKPIEYAAEVGNLEGISVFFPVTQRISSYREWSINGIKDYFHSAEAKIQRKQSQDAYFDFLDEKGKNAVKQEDYSFAAECFTEVVKKKQSRYKINVFKNHVIFELCPKIGIKFMQKINVFKNQRRGIKTKNKTLEHLVSVCPHYLC
ncbi:ankyrin repeat and socs box protein 3 [Phtheirospermum japonicum]|uniref:Ankyrin repeat and socs box protein 3 n=1 Tax=Phtheirospermum japonicum TaxID=374723 RepID=A0A830CK61_9LAMI|nr:ankyrin repeat and socs box protein 3 [Phtheirospermum japonicum]